MSDQNGNLDSPNLFRSNRRRLSPLSNESGTSAICEDELTGTIEGSCIQSENQCIQRGPDLLLPVPPNIVDVQNLDHHKRLHPGADCSGSLQPSQATTENIISEESSTHCSICFELFDDQVIVMPCGHQFDIACLKLVSSLPGPLL